jgi:hypothetical protein
VVTVVNKPGRETVREISRSFAQFREIFARTSLDVFLMNQNLQPAILTIAPDQKYRPPENELYIPQRIKSGGLYDRWHCFRLHKDYPDWACCLVCLRNNQSLIWVKRQTRSTALMDQHLHKFHSELTKRKVSRFLILKFRI